MKTSSPGAFERHRGLCFSPKSQGYNKMIIQQLSFDFNLPIRSPSVPHKCVSWRVRAIAQRHRLPLPLAAIIASTLGIPMGGDL